LRGSTAANASTASISPSRRNLRIAIVSGSCPARVARSWPTKVTTSENCSKLASNWGDGPTRARTRESSWKRCTSAMCAATDRSSFAMRSASASLRPRASRACALRAALASAFRNQKMPPFAAAIAYTFSSEALWPSNSKLEDSTLAASRNREAHPHIASSIAPAFGSASSARRAASVARSVARASPAARWSRSIWLTRTSRKPTIAALLTTPRAKSSSSVAVDDAALASNATRRTVGLVSPVRSASRLSATPRSSRGSTVRSISRYSLADGTNFAAVKTATTLTYYVRRGRL